MNPKKYVENEFKEAADIVDDIAGKSEVALLRGSAAKRRQQAILGCLDRANSEFGKMGPAERFLTTAELRPMLTYNSVNSNYDLTIAATLWILEKVRRTEHFHEMTKLLPDLTGDPDSMNLPMDFNHPCYSNDLIEAVVHVLKHRYDDGAETVGEEAARGNQSSDDFHALMSMIPEEDVDKACKVFKEKQWELLSRFARCYALITKELDRLDEAFNRSIEPPSPLLVRQPMNSKDDLQQLTERTEKLTKTRAQLTVRFVDYLQMERRQIIRQTGSRQIADELSGFDIDDPFEICFAIFALIERQDDAVWLVSAGSHLCEFALHMLPWFVDNSDWDEDDWDSWFDGMIYNINGWVDDDPPEEEVDFYHTRFQGRTLAQIVYDLSRGVVPVGLHPFEKNRQEMIAEGMDERTARKVIDMAEMLFLRDFQAQPYKPFEPFGWEGAEEEKAETEEKTTSIEPDITPGGYWGRTFGIKAPEPVKEKPVRTEDRTEVQSEELEKAKQEIKALRDALYRERREARDVQARAEHELKSLRLEHRELADLRTLVFNQQAEDQRRVEKVERQISYPYQTRKRTVVFGGHDSFLRAIRPLLPDVKFVDTENYAFAPEIVRNADVVWVQTNCISHSQYNNITRVARQYGIQMRYFGYASAEKCAEQLVVEDEKR